jgi:hypothetical protein
MPALGDDDRRDVRGVENLVRIRAIGSPGDSFRRLSLLGLIVILGAAGWRGCRHLVLGSAFVLLVFLMS